MTVKYLAFFSYDPRAAVKPNIYTITTMNWHYFEVRWVPVLLVLILGIPWGDEAPHEPRTTE